MVTGTTGNVQVSTKNLVEKQVLAKIDQGGIGIAVVVKIAVSDRFRFDPLWPARPWLQNTNSKSGRNSERIFIIILLI